MLHHRISRRVQREGEKIFFFHFHHVFVQNICPCFSNYFFYLLNLRFFVQFFFRPFPHAWCFFLPLKLQLLLVFTKHPGKVGTLVPTSSRRNWTETTYAAIGRNQSRYSRKEEEEMESENTLNFMTMEKKDFYTKFIGGKKSVNKKLLKKMVIY